MTTHTVQVSENMVDEISKFKKEIKFIYEEVILSFVSRLQLVPFKIFIYCCTGECDDEDIESVRTTYAGHHQVCVLCRFRLRRG